MVSGYVLTTKFYSLPMEVIRKLPDISATRENSKIQDKKYNLSKNSFL